MITEVRDTILVPLEEFNSETIASTALDPVSREVNALSKEILSSQNPIPVPREKQGRSRKTTLRWESCLWKLVDYTIHGPALPLCARLACTNRGDGLRPNFVQTPDHQANALNIPRAQAPTKIAEAGTK